MADQFLSQEEIKKKKITMKKCKISKTIQETMIEKKEIQVSEIIQLFFKNKSSTKSKDKDKSKIVNEVQQDELSQNEKLGYYQVTNDTIKIEVKMDDQLLVLTFILCEFDIGKGLQQYVLVYVHPVWQEWIQKKIEEINNYKMKMFGSISHELRTPLNCSISMLEFLEQELHNSNLVEEYIQPALYSNKLLLSLINDILDFVQIGCGKFKFCFVEFNLYHLLTGTLLLISMQAKAKQLQVELQYDQNIPKVIRSDPNRLRQILLNFLSNSLKFTKQGKIIIKVNELSPEDSPVVKKREDLIKISVIDTGIGISQDNINKLFIAFNKIDNNQEQQELNPQGCGLGLTISQQLAKGLGPQNFNSGINVKSTVGQGSCFSFLLENKKEKATQMINFNQIDIQNLQQEINEEKQIKELEEEYDQKSSTKYKNLFPKSKPLDLKNVCIQIEKEDLVSPVAQETLITNQNYVETSQIQLQNLNINSDNSINNQMLQSKSLSSDKLIGAGVFKFPSFSEDFNQGKYLSQSEYILINNQMRKNKRKVSEKSMKTTTINNINKNQISFNESYLSYNSFNNSISQIQDQNDNIFQQNNNTAVQEQLKQLKENLLKQCQCTKVLIVDDNNFNLYVLGKMMNSYGCSYQTATNGEQAIQKVIDRYNDSTCCKFFKLIFMDIQMPDMDGFETTTYILNFFDQISADFRTPIIACTANIGEEDKQKVYNCGMSDFISKPIIKDGLDSLMLKWIKDY